jgi:hypothetical protein
MWWMGEVVGKGLEPMSWCARTGERIGSAVNNSPGPTVYDLPRAPTLRHTACLFVCYYIVFGRERPWHKYITRISPPYPQGKLP